MLELQSEGSEGDLLRHRQYGHSGQIRIWIPNIPLTGGRVEMGATCRTDLSLLQVILEHVCILMSCVLFKVFLYQQLKSKVGENVKIQPLKQSIEHHNLCIKAKQKDRRDVPGLESLIILVRRALSLPTQTCTEQILSCTDRLFPHL